MKRLSALTACLVLASTILPPAFADAQFDSLVAERNALIQKVQCGQGTDADVARVQTIVQQIRDLTNARIQANMARQSSLIQNLDRVDRQNAALEQTLFGNVSQVANVSSATNVSPSAYTSLVPAAPHVMGPPLKDVLDKMLHSALDRSEEWKAAVAAEAKYNGVKQKTKELIFGMIDSLMPYRGFEDSKTVGDVILDEKVDIKSVASAKYAQQKIVDQIHYQIVLNTLQLAQGLGESDLPKAEAAYKFLSTLTSTEDADTLKSLLDSHLQDNIAAESYTDVLAAENAYQGYLKRALEHDQIIKSIQDRVHKYNHLSKTQERVAQVVPAVLGIARFAPYGIGIGAGVALGGFYAITGGSELSKILKELYLGESLQSRTNLYVGEIRLAMMSQKADNHVLCWAAQSILNQ
jgi:hypothetical protein